MDRSAVDKGLKYSKRAPGDRKISRGFGRIGLPKMSFSSAIETMWNKYARQTFASNNTGGYY